MNPTALFNPRRVSTVIIGAVIAILVLPPIIGAVFGSFWSQSPIVPGGNFTLINWPNVLMGRSFLTSLLTTLELTIITSPISTVIGSLLAFYVARTNGRFRGLIEACVRFNLMLTPFVLAIAWLALGGGNSGLINLIPVALGGEPSFNIATIPGISFVMITYFVPWIYTAIKPAIEQADSRLEDAANVFGAGTGRILWSVTFPLLRPVIASSAVLVFVLGLEMFSIPAVLGAPHGVTTLSYVMFTNVQMAPAAWQNASVIGTVLLLACFAGIALQRKLVGNVQRYQSVGISPPMSRLDLGKVRPLVTTLATAYIFVATLLPLGALVLSSFVRYSAGMQFRADMFTLDVWRGIFASETFYLSLRNTLIVMLVGAIIGVIIAFFSAVLIYWIKPRFAGAVEYAVRLPIAIPGVVMGAGLAWAYCKFALPIYGTLAIIVLGVMTKALPPTFNLIAGRYTQIPTALREASLVSGAGRFGAVRDIDLKLMRGALLGAVVLSTILIVGEVNVSIMVAREQTWTLPVYLWNVVGESQNYQYVYGIALFQAGITTVLLVIFALLGRQRKSRGSVDNSAINDAVLAA